MNLYTTLASSALAAAFASNIFGISDRLGFKIYYSNTYNNQNASKEYGKRFDPKSSVIAGSVPVIFYLAGKTNNVFLFLLSSSLSLSALSYGFYKYAKLSTIDLFANITTGLVGMITVSIIHDQAQKILFLK